MRAEVEAAIEALRPTVRADGGDLVLKDLDEETGVVVIDFGSGAGCSTCPSSMLGLRSGVELILKDRVPGVTAVKRFGLDDPATELTGLH